MLYLILKCVHVVSLVSWMAGLLYLPRLYIYHIKSESGSIQSETFKIMERRLLKAIMNPAMFLTFISGLSMFYLNPYLILNTSMQIKVLLVLILAYVHGKFSKQRNLLEKDSRSLNTLNLKIWNEVPTCLMILIVILVIIKPF